MSDLRTRIMAALLSEDDVALMADAVIRDLQEKYILVPKSQTLAEMPPLRWPEEWKADDE